MTALVFAQPGWLAATLMAVVAAALGLRARRRERVGWGSVAVGVGLAGAFVLLARAGGGWPAVLLAGAGVGCGLWLSAELYRRTAAEIARGLRGVLLVLRACAWVVLFTLIARPAVEGVRAHWERPVLAVLLDNSQSMGIQDDTGGLAAGGSRVARVQAGLGASQAALTRLDELYDVRVHAIGLDTRRTSDWAVAATAPFTGLARALHTAGALRSAQGQPPPVVLVISDGAETVADAAAVLQAADELAAARTALVALGVGPARYPLVELAPLTLPRRVALRETLRVPAAGRVRECRGATLTVEALWDGVPAAATHVQIDSGDAEIAPLLEVQPTEVGAHHLAVRVTLPATLDSATFSVSTIVEVEAGRVRVVCVEEGPRTEAAFVARALLGDPGLELQQVMLSEMRDPGSQAPAEGWSLCDVVVCGRLRADVPAEWLDELAAAVTERGVGLLLTSAAEFLDPVHGTQTALGDVCPVRFDSRYERPPQRQFFPTTAGRLHPVFQGVATSKGAAQSPADERAVWEHLPALNVAAAMIETKPAATVLAADAEGVPLLAAQEVGRGRCLAASWESTWPWALASDQGSALHRRLWRQMVVWLANRRSRAWVITERPEYARGVVEAGSGTPSKEHGPIVVSAGVTGPAGAALRGRGNVTATLTLRGPDAASAPAESVSVRLEQTGDTWQAVLPQALARPVQWQAGKYQLDLAVSGTMQTRDAEELAATTSFVLSDEDRERRAPTADLGLLRTAAERTAAHGGRYASDVQLPAVLNDLARADRRERVEVRRRYDVVQEAPWTLLTCVLVVLAAEWSVRKRWGLA